jgi:hypothetical protein
MNIVAEREICTDAPSILLEAADCIADRAALRDQSSGERSMARAVDAFNAMKGTRLTEVDGWDFMELLKMSRSQSGKFHRDDYVDRAGYAALAGEAAEKAKL